RRRQRAARELRDHFSGGLLVTTRAFLSRLQHVVVNVERGAHSSHAIASYIKRQSGHRPSGHRPSWGQGTMLREETDQRLVGQDDAPTCWPLSPEAIMPVPRSLADLR